jgi:hypothetical protein
MKNYKIIKKDKLIGIQDLSNKSIIIPFDIQEIEIFCNQYFYITKDGRKFIVNRNNEIVFDFMNTPHNPEFITKSGTYKVLCFEEIGDSLSIFGKNIDSSISEELQINKTSIFNNGTTHRFMGNAAYFEIMNDTGFNIGKLPIDY